MAGREENLSAMAVKEEKLEKEVFKIPVFSVLKKGSIIKNIFINVSPPEMHPLAQSQENTSVASEGREAEPILIGRHPDCHIMLDHPSISRFHLEIRADLASRKLSVTDRSSVHGTWVSGRKIEPLVPVDLVEGDTVRLGASTRVYQLQWVSLSQAFEMESPLEPLLEEKEESRQESSGSVISNANEIWDLEIPSAPPLPESMNLSFPDKFFSFPLGRDVQESRSPQGISDAQMLESVDSSLPVNEENGIQEQPSLVKENLSPERLEKPVKSSKLLSRRCKSVGFLQIPSGRSKERICHMFDRESEVEFQEDSSMELKLSKRQETLHKVLFGGLVGEEDEISALDKENVTPGFSMGQKLEVMLTELQKLSLDAIAALKMEEGFCWGKEEKFVEGEEGEEEKFASDKENLTLGTSYDQKLQNNTALGVEEGYSDLESWTPEAIKYLSSNKPIFRNHVKSEKEEEKYTSDNENLTPNSSMVKKLRKSNLGLSRSSLSTITASNAEADVFSSDKLNLTPLVPKPMLEYHVNCEKEEEKFASDKENLTPEASVGKNSRKSKLGLRKPSSSVMTTLNAEENVFKNQTSGVPKCLNSKKSMSQNHAKCEKEEETFASDKENLTPNSSVGKKLRKSNLGLQKLSSSVIKVLNSEEHVFNLDRENWTPEGPRECKPKSSVSLPCVKNEREEDPFASDNENLTPDASGALRLNKSLSKSHAEIERAITKRRAERIPFQSLLNSPVGSNSSDCHSQRMVDKGNFHSDNSNLKSITPNNVQRPVDKSGRTLNQSVNQVLDNAGEEKKIWNMVVDTSCFLDEESRRSLQLLEGLKGTHLIIPRMVIRELDHMKRHESWFRKATKVSSALQWIKECMVKASWWIHVQSSLEILPVAPTPPATPPSVSDEGSSEFSNATSNSTSFSTYGSLTEIISPTAEDHILDCALLFKRIKTDGPFVLLTNNVTLKIKAMAEGLLCETPKEFHESLVNPYSERFMWVKSSPRGSTWTCLDEMGLIDSYCHQFLGTGKMAKANDHVKGLKLILLHNSQYGKINLGQGNSSCLRVPQLPSFF